ncbi:hypothetical protein JR316_0004106 [Psilocybe cubensis]|uniref:NGN domain-containing protein n=2 Tax=Psilocybe cubensis TaxID=181762 RepID=A0A8H8CNQ6_PSICU|nr:hypothetical protein JR316_0004106 [Psilocybe cubensis]KAH9484624.1 hypothetical protein JR316_0004106 [Psilocybe cubensis]
MSSYKRRRLDSLGNHTDINPFIDIEAAVSDDDESSEELDYEGGQLLNDNDEYSEDEERVAHSRLYHAMQNTDNADEWSDLLPMLLPSRMKICPDNDIEPSSSRELIQKYGNPQPGGLGDNNYMPSATDIMYEIGCKVGREEAVAFKIMQMSTNPTFPIILARSVFAQSSIPGRIYVEAPSMQHAHTLACLVRELNPTHLVRLSSERCMEILSHPPPSRPEDQLWVKVAGKRKAWTTYANATGLVFTFQGRKSVVLIPRPPDNIKKSHLDRIFQDGFIITDFDAIDLKYLSNVLPTSSELEQFRECPFVTTETLAQASKAISMTRLKQYD